MWVNGNAHLGPGRGRLEGRQRGPGDGALRLVAQRVVAERAGRARRARPLHGRAVGRGARHAQRHRGQRTCNHKDMQRLLR